MPASDQDDLAAIKGEEEQEEAGKEDEEAGSDTSSILGLAGDDLLPAPKHRVTGKAKVRPEAASPSKGKGKAPTASPRVHPTEKPGTKKTPAVPAAMPQLDAVQKAVGLLQQVDVGSIWKGFREADINGRLKKMYEVLEPLEKAMLALVEDSPAHADASRAVSAAQALMHSVPQTQEVIGKLKAAKLSMVGLLKDELFCTELNAVLKSPGMDPELLANILSHMATKVTQEAWWGLGERLSGDAVGAIGNSE